MDRISPDAELALIVVDMQERFRGDHARDEDGWRIPVSVIGRTMECFRSAGRPVVLLRMEGPCSCHPWDGPDSDVFIDELRTSPSDIVITKPHMNGFRETELADELKRLGCDTLLICGTVTNLCVMSTYYSAYDYGFIPYILKDGTVGTKAGVNEAACIVCNCITAEQAEEHLRG